MALSATTSTDTGSPSGLSLSRVSTTRRVLPLPSGMVSPERQSGTAVFSVGGSAGVPVFLFEPVEECAHSVSLPLSVGTERHGERIAGFEAIVGVVGCSLAVSVSDLRRVRERLERKSPFSALSLPG
jgi:hypothetical protein